MAEAVPELALDNLSSLIQKKIGLFLGFEKDFKSLSSLITTIKATLEDAEEKQFTDKAVKVWLLTSSMISWTSVPPMPGSWSTW